MFSLDTLVSALRSGHWLSLVGAWLHFEVSFMVWLLIGAFLRVGVGLASDRLEAKRGRFSR